ncbi:MAG TPA: 5-dehydro-4-deoxy-D-glucuronate isomerase [Vicinamibacteria bacterium]|nr:5-dehydro-4-deoxy-D-glucuronate isomerase [Vicinamibacteria bacterium]
MTTAELREAFLVEDLFARGEVRLLHWESERTIIGGVVPAERPLALDAPPEIKADSFASRREVGIVNVGATGSVRVDGDPYEMGPRDILYVGRGAREIAFSSLRAAEPAQFYLVSHPAHASHPTRRVTHEEAQSARIGSAENASARVLRRYIHGQGALSCQLVMGVTALEPGSVWNTLPPHTHTRRTEIYLYFDLAPGATAFHFMGPPEGTRHLVVRDRQAVLSPPWSMHFGAATSPYAFVWSMGGENQEFEDMQTVELDRLR